MLRLPDVTLVTLDNVCHELTALAINECIKHAEFGDVKIFSDREIIPGTVITDKISSIESGANFAYHEMLDYIQTTHILFIQWDSWIIDPGMWTDRFLEYDYVGAPWWYKDKYNVGNSGFCLRSKAMMRFLASRPDEFPLKLPEDHMLCRVYQPRLPQFKWAPEPVASSFSFERSRVSIDSRHFGFHGMFNWPFVLSPAELAERTKLAQGNAYIQGSGMLTELFRTQNLHWVKLTEAV